MSAPGASIFSQVRSKLRHSHSDIPLSPSLSVQPQSPDWDNIPMAYHPLERVQARQVNGYHMGRPLPGPPPRPRSASPIPTFEPSASLAYGTLKIPTPRTQRRRSGQAQQRTWTDLQDHETDTAVGVPLASEDSEPPPPYSRYPPPPPCGRAPRPHSLPPHTGAYAYVRPYNPGDYASARDDSTRQVPTIGQPQPPTPVSPISALDLQYLAMRPCNKPPATAEHRSSSVTIDSLLSHPMLQHADETLR